MPYDRMNELIDQFNTVNETYQKHYIDSVERPTDYELINLFESEFGNRNVPVGAEFIWTTGGVHRQTLQKLPVDNFLSFTSSLNVREAIPHPTKENTVLATTYVPIYAFPLNWDNYGLIEIEMPGKVTTLNSSINNYEEITYHDGTGKLFFQDSGNVYRCDIDGTNLSTIYTVPDGYNIDRMRFSENYIFLLGTLASVWWVRRLDIDGTNSTDIIDLSPLISYTYLQRARDIFHISETNQKIYATRRTHPEIRSWEFDGTGETITNVPLSLGGVVRSDYRDNSIYFHQHHLAVLADIYKPQTLDLVRLDLDTFEVERRQLHKTPWLTFIPYNEKYMLTPSGTYPNPFQGESSERFWGVTPYNTAYQDFALIAENEVTTPTSAFSVDIPQTHEHLLVQMALNVTGATAYLENVVIDIGENARGIKMDVLNAGASVYSESAYPETLFDIHVSEDTQNADRQAIVNIWIPYYRQLWEHGIFIHTYAHGQQNASQRSSIWHIMTDTQNAITSIGVDTETAQNFNIRSRIKVYGFGSEGEFDYGNLYTNP